MLSWTAWGLYLGLHSSIDFNCLQVQVETPMDTPLCSVICNSILPHLVDAVYSSRFKLRHANAVFRLHVVPHERVCHFSDLLFIFFSFAFTGAKDSDMQIIDLPPLHLCNPTPREVRTFNPVVSFLSHWTCHSDDSNMQNNNPNQFPPREVCTFNQSSHFILMPNLPFRWIATCKITPQSVPPREGRTFQSVISFPSHAEPAIQMDSDMAKIWSHAVPLTQSALHEVCAFQIHHLIFWCWTCHSDGQQHAK